MRLTSEQKANELYEAHFAILTRKGEYSFSHQDTIDSAILNVKESIKAIEVVDWQEVQNLERDMNYWIDVISYLYNMKDL
jgi:hypothetical protein